MDGQDECAGPERAWAVPQPRWSKALEMAFLAALRSHCDVVSAARSLGLKVTRVHERRRRHAGFAAAWQMALADGYAELEWRLLGQALLGAERTEKVHDAKGNGVARMKAVHGLDPAHGLRLLLAHRAAMEAAPGDEAGTLPDGGEAALGQRLRAAMDEIRSRLLTSADAGHDARVTDSRTTNSGKTGASEDR